MTNINQSIANKAACVKLFAMDIDGVLSDGKIVYHSDGVEMKAFCVQDGLGLQALNQAGIQLAIITGRTSSMVERRAKELGVHHIIQGRDDKFTALSILANSLGLSLQECAYMGDDLPDLKAIRQAGFGISVPNATATVRESADFITTKAGGNGAVREVCDFILQAQGKYNDFIKRFL